MAIPLVSLLFGLLIFALVFWGVRRIMAAFGIGDPIATIVYVVLVIFFVLWLGGLLGVLPGLRISG